jgi:hypothetical protein
MIHHRHHITRSNLWTSLMLFVVSILLLLTPSAFAQVPSGWNEANIGSGTGICTTSGNSLTLASNAAPLANGINADGMYFMYQQKSGAFEIIGQMDTLTPYGNDSTRLFFMVREGLTPGARYFSAWRRGRSGGIGLRTTTNGAATEQGKVWSLTQTSPNLHENDRWYRIVRWGNNLSIFRSSNSTDWGTPWATLELPGLSNTLYFGVGVAYVPTGQNVTVTGAVSNLSINSVNRPYTTSWLGQTYAGISVGIRPNSSSDLGSLRKHVAMNVEGLALTPSGKLATICRWDEQGPNITFYDSNGNFTGGVTNTRNFGTALTADSNYIYIATDRGVRRVDNEGTPVGWTGAESINRLIVNAAGYCRGIALNSAGTELFVADTPNNAVRVYDPATMSDTPLRSFTVSNPNQLALDDKGNIWVVQQKNSTTPASILRFAANSTGTPTPQKTITGIGNPQGIFYDAPRNRLLVCDAGTDSVVKIYTAATINAAGTISVYDSLFGTLNGIMSGTPGEISDLKFNRPVGIAVSSGGAVYVACNYVHPTKDYSQPYPLTNDVSINGLGTGSELYGFSSTSATSVSWARYGLEGMSSAVVDPGDENSVYSQYHRYSMDYSAGIGAEATYEACTLDAASYPHDLRIYTNPSSLIGGMRVVRTGGSKFLFVWTQAKGYMMAYRFEPGSEIAIPCAAFGGVVESDWPPNRGFSDSRWIWIDANGNGNMDAGEFQANPDTANIYYNARWFVDKDANVWLYYNNFTIRKYSCGGTNANGALTYSATGTTIYTLPSEVRAVSQIWYDGANDDMYLLADTQIRPGTLLGYGGVPSTEILRYSNWTGARSLTWRTPAPRFQPKRQDENTHSTNVPTHLAFAGNYLYVAYSGDASVYALDKVTGSVAERYLPGPEVAGESGLLDIPIAVNAFQRSNGEYLIFAEENCNAKVLMYRDTTVPSPSPTGITAQARSTTRIVVNWTDTSTTESGFHVDRSASSQGPWTNINSTTANVTSYTDNTCLPNTTYFYRVRAWSGNGSSTPSNIAAATTFPDAIPTGPFGVKINFQPEQKPGNPSNVSQPWVTVEVPAGYQPDFGLLYGNRQNGYIYGWDDDTVRFSAADRDSINSADQVHDTLIPMYDVPGRRWEIAVPNGLYSVKIVSGDPTTTNDQYKIDIEGTLAINGNQTTGARWLENTVTVNVTDGHLTLTNATGNVNKNKVCSLEINQVNDTQAGLHAWWKLDETTGTTATDTTGNGWDGTLIGATWNPSGKISGSAEFSGSSAYIELPANCFLSADAPITLTTWFKSNSSGTIAGQQSTTYPSVPGSHVPCLYIGTDGKLRGQWGAGSAVPITTPNVMNDGNWHHVALVGTNSNQQMYVDGNLIGNFITPTNHSTKVKNQLGIGWTSNGYPSGNSSWFPFSGLLDDVRLYHRVLSHWEIKQLALA